MLHRQTQERQSVEQKEGNQNKRYKFTAVGRKGFRRPEKSPEKRRQKQKGMVNMTQSKKMLGGLVFQKRVKRVSEQKVLLVESKRA